MVNGIDLEEDGKKLNWRAVNIQAGFYQINIGSTYETDDLDKIVKEAIKQLLEVKDKIPISEKPVMGSEIG
jgi:S-ribosylhomocysteine lyase LuxS involved in autoinducer biosynthesis